MDVSGECQVFASVFDKDAIDERTRVQCSLRNGSTGECGVGIAETLNFDVVGTDVANIEPCG